MTKEPAIGPDWCQSAALKPCRRPPPPPTRTSTTPRPPRLPSPGEGVMCGAHTCLCTPRCDIRGEDGGASRCQKFQGNKFVRIFLQGQEAATAALFTSTTFKSRDGDLSLCLTLSPCPPLALLGYVYTPVNEGGAKSV